MPAPPTWTTSMTTLRTPTLMPAVSPPPELAGEASGARYLLVGPSLHGWVYRAATGTGYCHAVPIEATPLSWREEVRRRIAAVSRGDLARVVDHVVNPVRAGQDGVGDFYVIHYDAGEPTQSLADLLASRIKR